MKWYVKINEKKNDKISIILHIYSDMSIQDSKFLLHFNYYIQQYFLFLKSDLLIFLYNSKYDEQLQMKN